METDMSAAFEQERRARARLEGVLSGDAEARIRGPHSTNRISNIID